MTDIVCSDLNLVESICVGLPLQINPFPVYPAWQVHLLLPTVFLHVARE